MSVLRAYSMDKRITISATCEKIIAAARNVVYSTAFFY